MKAKHVSILSLALAGLVGVSGLTSISKSPTARPVANSASKSVFLGQITGKAFSDFNNNGVFDGKDRYKPDTIIYLTSAQLKSPQKTTTNDRGTFYFSRLSEGNYLLLNNNQEVLREITLTKENPRLSFDIAL